MRTKLRKIELGQKTERGLTSASNRHHPYAAPELEGPLCDDPAPERKSQRIGH